MRKFLFGAAALLAAAPGVAMAQTGYVDLSYQNSNVEVGPFEGEGDGWTAGGATAFDLGGLGAQIDGQIGNFEADGGGDTDVWNVGGHLFSRQSAGLIGGFVSYGNIDVGAADAGFWTVGVEGQYYLQRTTLNGAVSYSEGDDDLDANLTAVDLGLKHFVTDNFSLDGGIGFGNIEGGGGDVDAMTLGFGGEYQFAAMPISLFGGYNRAEIDDIDTTSDTFNIGVRYNWGGSLFDRDRSGANLGRGGGLGRYAGIL